MKKSEEVCLIWELSLIKNLTKNNSLYLKKVIKIINIFIYINNKFSMLRFLSISVLHFYYYFLNFNIFFKNYKDKCSIKPWIKLRI